GRYGEEDVQARLDQVALKSIRETPNEETQRTILRAMRRVRQEKGQPLNAELSAAADALAPKLLQNGDEGAVRRGLELVRELALKSAADDLVKLAAPG